MYGVSQKPGITNVFGINFFFSKNRWKNLFFNQKWKRYALKTANNFEAKLECIVSLKNIRIKHFTMNVSRHLMFSKKTSFADLKHFFVTFQCFYKIGNKQKCWNSFTRTYITLNSHEKKEILQQKISSKSA